MKNIVKLSMLLFTVITLSACSQGYYSHVPRVKTQASKQTVENEKKTEAVFAQAKVEDNEAEVVVINNAKEEVKPNTSSAVVATVKETKTAEQVNVTGTKEVKTEMVQLPKRVMNKITKKLQPKEVEKTNHSSVSILGLVIVGLILMILFDGTIAAIGYLLVLIALVLLLLSLLGAHHH